MRLRWPAAAMAALAMICLTHCALSPLQKGAEGRIVRFTYVAPGAASVCVSGSFNGWSAGAHCMRRDGSTWSTSITLPPGRYEYGFLLDGETWQTDPGSTLSEDSGFGRPNSVLIVE